MLTRDFNVNLQVFFFRVCNDFEDLAGKSARCRQSQLFPDNKTDGLLYTCRINKIYMEISRLQSDWGHIKINLYETLTVHSDTSPPPLAYNIPFYTVLNIYSYITFSRRFALSGGLHCPCPGLCVA